jgi:hypothetical protein
VCVRNWAAVIVVIGSGDPLSPYSSPVSTRKLPHQRLTGRGWRSLAQGKLANLDDQIAKAQTAKEAITHALHCPHDDITTCPNFTNLIAARPAGQPLQEAHPH